MADTTPCRKCSLPLAWVVVAGRPQAQNPDGSSHWSICSQARNERIKREGKPFTDDEGDGFIFGGKKHYFHKVAATRFGKPVDRKSK